MRQREKVYLAGPMRGYDQFNFPAFYEAETALRRMGYAVANPARHDEDGGFDPTKNTLEGFNLHAAMRWDIACVIESDLVVFLPGWSKSEGCTIEKTVADACGVEVRYYVPELSSTWDRPLMADGGPGFGITMPGARAVETKTILDEATRAVDGPRRSYGHPRDNFRQIADLWTAYVGRRRGEAHAFTPEDVGAMMILVKLAREVSAHHRDNLVDVAGYARTLEMLHDD